MARHTYHLVDVFTDRLFGGNPLAVFPDGHEVPERLYQSIARELNLAETTFVLPPADAANHFSVRIFTPAAELPMAGHPTVGTADVLARLGRFDAAARGGTLRFEEGVGVIPVQVALEGGAPGPITMSQPRPAFGPVFPGRDVFAAVLGLGPDDLAEAPVQCVSCGLPYWIAGLRDLEAVRRVRVRHDLFARDVEGSAADALFVFAREAQTPGAAVHGRMFAPALGVVEDPATGSAAGPLGCYLVRHGLVPPVPTVSLVIEQGFEMGRPSFIHVAVDTAGEGITGVRVGGRCVPVGAGTLHL